MKKINTAKYLSPQTRQVMRQTIEEAHGNEVFFIGYVDKNLQVHTVDVVARGHQQAVPAVTDVAQKADVVIHNHPSGHLAPSDADLDIAAYLDGFQVAFYIINNRVNDLYPVIEPFEKKEIKHLDSHKIKSYLLSGGSIQKKLPGFEERREQLLMIDNVCKAFNQEKIAVIEAGTGTGKTLAYLLPAIHWALENRERIVVSTNTINLQEQLIKKDLPFLNQTLDLEFEAVLVKGRRNYICLRKLDDVRNDYFQFDDDEKDELNILIKWAKTTNDGSRSDLSFIPKQEIWEKIASESDTCNRLKCPYFRKCFVNKARRRAARAQILVVNHHLLFADLALRHQIGSNSDAAVLPPYQRIIFDEAHHLEDVASHYFGAQITRAGILRILARLHRQKKNRTLGLLTTLKRRLDKQGQNLSRDLADKIHNHVSQQLVADILHLNQKTDEITGLIFETLNIQSTGNSQYEIKLRLKENVQKRLFEETSLAGDVKDYLLALKSLVNNIYQLVEWLHDCQQQLKVDWSSMVIEIKAQADRLLLAAETINAVVFNCDEAHVRWIETRVSKYGNNIVRFAVSPLDISETMVNAVYDCYESVIMTSATLAVDQKFTFFNKRTGLAHLDAERIHTSILASTFQFEKQVLLGVPLDMPAPNHSDYANRLAEDILKILMRTQGKAFILFTSYGLLNVVYNQLNHSLSKLGITPLKQGKLNRHELINRFRQDKHSVLFATDSFWEGVDVAGQALENVMITKLPFKVPNEPIIEARYEAIEKEGGNAFMEYAVPIAVIKLKQGFGRLIRSRSDRGTVIIFDNRVVKKSYGKKFLNSLPKCHTAICSQEELMGQLDAFLKSDANDHYTALKSLI